MPSLTPEDQKQLLGPVHWVCATCGQTPVKNYCRQCDEFFNECGCHGTPAHLIMTPELIVTHGHEGHRTY